MVPTITAAAIPIRRYWGDSHIQLPTIRAITARSTVQQWMPADFHRLDQNEASTGPARRDRSGRAALKPDLSGSTIAVPEATALKCFFIKKKAPFAAHKGHGNCGTAPGSGVVVVSSLEWRRESPAGNHGNEG